MKTDEYARQLKYKMSRIKGRETKPEIHVRSVLHRLGFRFRKNVSQLPGNPDIVLPKHNTIIFVHGCFWHQHKGCKKCKIPKSNVEFWTDKLLGNRKRDRLHNRGLRLQGWRVMTVWECQVGDKEKLSRRLSSFLKTS